MAFDELPRREDSPRELLAAEEGGLASHQDRIRHGIQDVPEVLVAAVGTTWAGTRGDKARDYLDLSEDHGELSGRQQVMAPSPFGVECAGVLGEQCRADERFA